MKNIAKNMSDVPVNVLAEIDFMLGSVEECEYLEPILAEYGINPNGGFLFMDRLPDDVILAIYNRLFVPGILEPFYTVEEVEAEEI